jgi:peptidoglycan hydrolase-like protein with peptidoglycan-binding domain
MRVLREGMTGDDVRDWQLFLATEGYQIGAADGDFGPKTTKATKLFQVHHGQVSDGIVGVQTMRIAMGLGFDPLDWPTISPPTTTDPFFPPKPTNLAALTIPKAEALYGKFAWKKAPTAGEKRAIRHLDNWPQKNIVIVAIPQLAKIAKPMGINREMHKLAQKKMLALWQAWDDAGLLKYIKTFHGIRNPRVIGGTSTLSNHAFAVAFDINEPWNTWGGQPALVGQPGSVRLLVPLANQHGFFWGGHYNGKKDGMHFELVDPN